MLVVYRRYTLYPILATNMNETKNMSISHDGYTKWTMHKTLAPQAGPQTKV